MMRACIHCLGLSFGSESTRYIIICLSCFSSVLSIQVPFLVPSLSYSFETLVQCHSDAGVTDAIKVQSVGILELAVIVVHTNVHLLGFCATGRQHCAYNNGCYQHACQ